MVRHEASHSQSHRRHAHARLFHDRRQLRIGLFGGSFNPAHDGHLHLSNLAKRNLQLDEVWWIVSPQNPLKPTGEMALLVDRLASCRALVAGNSYIRVIAPEVEFGSSLTFQTLKTLKQRCSRHHFYWLMGADNMVTFPNWQRHKMIAASMPIAVIDRPGYSYRAMSRGELLLKGRLSARKLARTSLSRQQFSPSWCFIAGRRHHASATALRQAGLQSAFVESHN